jgi:hypothetical protein
MITQILLLAALVGQPMHGRMPPPYPGPSMRMQYRQAWNGNEAFWGAYGEWSSAPRFGRVWVPRVWREWRPYYYGIWIQSPGWGMSWSSDEPWGDICYHYGRWVWLQDIGWAWVPGYDWAPAWVYWYEGPDYYCWAPLDPEGGPASYGGYEAPNQGAPQYPYGWNSPQGQPAPPGGVAWVTVSKASLTRGNYQYLNRAPGRDEVKRIEAPQPQVRRPARGGPGPGRPVISAPPEVVKQLPQGDERGNQQKRDEFQRQWQEKAGARNSGSGKAGPGNGGPGKSDR